MYAQLVREYRFEAAHFLPKVPIGHRCRNIHGHSFRVEVTVGGQADEETGFVLDFYDLDRIVGAVVDTLDHKLLNDLPGLENPTSEILARHLYEQIIPAVPGLISVTLWETQDARCVYFGPAGRATR